ncbi:MAG TPA: DUF4124 domain-containing protein [Woeseiaceae bacterium]|nr:DUF4124 domain-containing protein [Woeseiaceae bacterium]
MKRNKSRTCALPGALLIVGLAMAGAVPASDIYKWTDAEGNVHFGDRPSGASTEERLAINSTPTDPDRVRDIVQARTDSRTERSVAEAAAKAAEPTAKEIRAAEAERKEKCNKYKDRLQKFVTSRRLYRQDENGERVYLDEEETLAARARVQEQVLEYCNP